MYTIFLGPTFLNGHYGCALLKKNLRAFFDVFDVYVTHSFEFISKQTWDQFFVLAKTLKVNPFPLYLYTYTDIECICVE